MNIQDGRKNLQAKLATYLELHRGQRHKVSKPLQENDQESQSALPWNANFVQATTVNLKRKTTFPDAVQLNLDFA